MLSVIVKLKDKYKIYHAPASDELQAEKHVFNSMTNEEKKDFVSFLDIYEI